MEGRTAGYLVGRHWTGPKGILEYSKLLASRQATKLAWTRWAHTAVRALGYQAAIASAAAVGAFHVVKYIKKNMDTVRYNRGTGTWKRRREADGDARPRRLFNDKNQGYEQITNVSDKCGKKITKSGKKMKLVGAHMQSAIERFQRVTDNAKLGAFRLAYDKAGTTASAAAYPVYCFELTGVTNYHTITGGALKICTPCPGWRLCQNGSTAAGGANTYYWGNDITLSGSVPIAGRDADNANDNYHWQTERSTRLASTLDAGNGNYVLPWGDKAMIEWVSARLLLYGAKNRPSRCTVEVVQFLDEEYVPKVYARNHTDSALLQVDVDSSDTTTAVTELERWNHFWLANTDNLVGNPISKRGLSEYNWDKHTKSLYRKTFSFQPTLTTEGDTTAHQIKVNLKININKVCDYVTGPDAGGIVAEDVISANEWDVQGAGKVSCVPNKKGRVFMFVTATNIENSSGVGNGETYPSFDMILRRKMSRIHI